MKAKDYLFRIKELDDQVESLLDELDRLRTAAKRVGGYNDSERVQTSGEKDAMAEAVVKYLMLEKRTNDKIVEAFMEREKIIEILNVLPAPERKVLRLIYVGGLDYYQVSEDNKKSYSWIKKAHARGLKKVQAELDRRYGATE